MRKSKLSKINLRGLKNISTNNVNNFFSRFGNKENEFRPDWDRPYSKFCSGEQDRTADLRVMNPAL